MFLLIHICIKNLVEETEKYNAQFWGRLQDEWKKISENEEHEHPWLSEFGDYYEPYKVYNTTFIYIYLYKCKYLHI